MIEMGLEKIIIKKADNVVTATMGDFSGTAVCSPEDKFDFFTGARIALDRLEEEFENENNEFKIGDIVEVNKTGYVCEDGFFDTLIQGRVIGFNKGINEKYIVKMVTGKTINVAEDDCELVKSVE